MRLIDADKIDFGKVFIGASDLVKDTREAAQELIDKMPTAYDTQKVINAIDNTVPDITNIQLMMICDIIMSGGVADE